jgi:16S rRNA processing protein RimM
MIQDNLICLGKIVKTFGYKGQVLVNFTNKITHEIKNSEFVFVEIQHEQIPFFIVEFHEHSAKSSVLQLEDVNDSDEASQLTGCNIYFEISETELTENPSKSVIGFEVIDEVFGPIGTIKDILELPQQQILQIFFKEKEILLPYIKEFVIKTDFKNRILKIHAPEGLIESYLQ